MNNQQPPNGWATPPPLAAPTSGLTPDLQRGLGVAILKARAGCCPSCDFLAGLRDQLAGQLAGSAPFQPQPQQEAAATSPQTLEVDTAFDA